MTKPNKRLRKSLLKLHRRIGLCAAVLVLILSVTGIALDHSDDFKLDQHYIASPSLMRYYGIQADPIRSYPVGSHYISQSGEHTYLNALPLNMSSSALCGAAELGAVFAICHSEGLLLLNKDGSSLEQLDNDISLPAPALGLGTNNNQLILITDAGDWIADSDFLDWQPYSGEFTNASLSNELPAELTEKINTHSLSHEIHWERFLLDLHSGRIFGSWGKYLMDFAALALIYLSLSGIYVWWKKR